MSHDHGAVCLCVVTHSPVPQELHFHHIHPLSEGGPDVPSNLVALCPSSHVNLHELLRELHRYDGVVPWEIRRGFGPYIRELAWIGYQRTIG